MRILFLSRSTLFTQLGGDSIQVIQTAQSLRDRGHYVDIILAGDNIPNHHYDVVHFFNLGRPQDALPYLPVINCPFVISSIWVDYTHADKKRKGPIGKAFASLPGNRQEYLKSIARGVIGRDNLPSLAYLVKGHDSAMKTLLKKSKAIICTTESEKNRIQVKFGNELPLYIVKLGVDNSFQIPETDFNERVNGIICVGRFERLKNQFPLIRVLKKNNIPALFIGKPAENQKDYFFDCVEEAKNSSIEFIAHVDNKELHKYYQKYKVVAIPSLFETFGLSGIEGWATGCNLIVSKTLDSTSEFVILGADTFNPLSEDEMEKALYRALKKGKNTASQKLRNQYSWEEAAKQLEFIYSKL